MAGPDFSNDTKVFTGSAEVTAGTTIANATLKTDFKTRFYDGELTREAPLNNEDFKNHNGNHAGSVSTVGVETGKFKGTARLPFSGSFAISPDIARYLKACGYQEIDYKVAMTSSNLSIGATAITVATGNGTKFTQGQIISLYDSSNQNTETVTVNGTPSSTNIPITATTKAYQYATSTVWAGKGYIPQLSADCSTMTIGQWLRKNGGASPSVIGEYINGATGTVEVGCDDIGAPLKAMFEFTGGSVSPVDLTTSDIPTYVGLSNESFDTIKNATCTVKNLTTNGSAVSQSITTFKCTAGNTVTIVKDGTTSTGFGYSYLAPRNPRITANPLLQTVAAENQWSEVLAANEVQFTAKLGHWSVFVPIAQRVTTQRGDRDGAVSAEITLRPLENIGTNAVSYANAVFNTGGAAPTADQTREITHEIIYGWRF